MFHSSVLDSDKQKSWVVLLLITHSNIQKLETNEDYNLPQKYITDSRNTTAAISITI